MCRYSWQCYISSFFKYNNKNKTFQVSCNSLHGRPDKKWKLGLQLKKDATGPVIKFKKLI